MIRESFLVKLLLRGSATLGLPALGDRLSGERLRILMYHGVTADDDYPGVVNHYGYNVPRRGFEAQVAYVAERCNPVSLTDVLEGRLSSRRVNVLLTFDDGYENNFTCAHPVLERFGVPAVFALPTDFVAERRPLWNDVIEHMVATAPTGEVSLSVEGESARFDLDDARGDGRLALLLWLMRRAALADPVRRGELLATVRGELGVEASAESLLDNPDYRPLDPDQIRAIVDAGLVEFASHSISHFMMARLPSEAKRQELETSKRQIEDLTGRECRAFCVPGGSYDEELLEIASQTGYEVVLTSDWGWAQRTAPTLNRCGIFASYDKYRFADEVHGPVVPSLLALRRALRGA